MTLTEPSIRHTKSAPAYFKAVTGAGVKDGTFDAIVAVFNNVDLGGDRLIPGCFAESIADWQKSGDPIPVIFSHQWDDLYAHVGEVDPANVKELLPGDSELPPELKDLGGLLIKGAQMDLGAPGEAGAFASNLWGKLSRRSIKEFSFAYDIPPGGARAAKDATDLIKVGLIEVGPTLKGMNPATALLNAKAARKAIDGLTPEAALMLLDDLVPVPRSSARSSSTAKAAPANTKRLPTGTRPEGAVETVLDAVSSSARLWGLAKYGNELYAVHLEGTFLDTGKAVITAERWSDPYGEGPVFELSFELGEDGTATITDSKDVDVVVTLTHAADVSAGKRRAKALLDRGFDRKTALWLTFLDADAVGSMYGGDPAGNDDPDDDEDDDPIELARSLDAVLDTVADAITAGKLEVADALIVSAETASDALLDALHLEEDSEPDDATDAAALNLDQLIDQIAAALDVPNGELAGSLTAAASTVSDVLLAALGTTEPEASTGGTASRAYSRGRKRGQGRGARKAKTEEPSAASSPTGVLLALEELETNP